MFQEPQWPGCAWGRLEARGFGMAAAGRGALEEGPGPAAVGPGLGSEEPPWDPFTLPCSAWRQRKAGCSPLQWITKLLSAGRGGKVQKC